MVDTGVVASGCLLGLDSDRPLKPRDVLRGQDLRRPKLRRFEHFGHRRRHPWYG